jgi:hypothetical protein
MTIATETHPLFPPFLQRATNVSRRFALQVHGKSGRGCALIQRLDTRFRMNGCDGDARVQVRRTDANALPFHGSAHSTKTQISLFIFPAFINATFKLSKT